MIEQVPTISIVFDDNHVTIHSEAFVRMQALGLLGCIYVITKNIGSSDPILITEAQLNEMYAAGWDVSNHTWQHKNMQDADAATILEQYEKGRDELNESTREYWRSSELFVYPFNAYDQLTQDIITANGAKYISTDSSQAGLYNPYPIDLLHIQRCAVGVNSVANVKAMVDYTIANNVYNHMYFHGIAEPIGYLYPPDMFQEVIEYIALKRDQGLLKVKTCSQMVREHNPTTAVLQGDLTTF